MAHGGTCHEGWQSNDNEKSRQSTAPTTKESMNANRLHS